MPKPRILPIDHPILELEEEISHTRSGIRAYAVLAALMAPFGALLLSWQALLQQELDLDREVLDAEARIVAVDDAMDYLAVAISSTLLAELGGDRKSTRYLRYFSEAPNRLARPLLGDQLSTMRGWVPSLTEAQSSPAIQGYGQQLAARVQEADDAVRGLAEAEQRRADFLKVGARKAFVDNLNALRLTTYGQLAELPHKQPELNLPRDFADRFFLRDTSDRKPTIAGVEHAVLRLRERLKRQEELLARLIEEAEQEARLQEESEVRAVEAALQEAERKQAEAAQRVAEVRAKLAGRKKEG